MKIEKWNNWQKFDEGSCFLSSLSYNYGILKVQIDYKQSGITYLVIFVCPIYFRCMDEADLLQYQNQINYLKNCERGFIYQLFDSPIIKYCHQEKLGILGIDEYLHFQIITDDHFIDIVTTEDNLPKIIEL